MMRLFALLVVISVLSGCVTRTQVDVPAFSGVVVDGSTGVRLNHVGVNEQYTDQFGRFSFPSTGVRKVSAMPAPGAGWPVHRTLRFHKTGYRDTTCTATNMSLFPEDNRATIPLLKLEHSKPLSVTPQRLRLGETSISCEVFVGSKVIYEGEPYTVEEAFVTHIEEAQWLNYRLRGNDGKHVEAVDYKLRLFNRRLDAGQP